MSNTDEYRFASSVEQEVRRIAREEAKRVIDKLPQKETHPEDGSKIGKDYR